MTTININDGGVPVYSTLSAFPSSTNTGSLAVAEDTLLLYVFSGSTWEEISSGGGSGVTSVTATTPLSSSGGTTPNLTIQTANTSQSGYLSSTDWNTFNNKQSSGNYITALTGDVTASGPGSSAASVALVGGSTAANVHTAEQLVNNSKSINTVFAGPSSGSSAAPSFRSLVVADIPTLNQNTTGTAANVTGTVAIANGGTGQTSQQSALNALSGAVTSGYYLRGNGTNVSMSAIQSSDLPSLSGTYVPQSSVGVANGVASLDSSGKMPITQLPSSVYVYQGSWNPTTNTPTLVDGSGTSGYTYRVSAAYSGTISGLNDSSMTNFQIGNSVTYSGTVWQQFGVADGVTFVNGAQGSVTVNAINQLTGDATAGPATQSQSQVLTLATVNSNIGSFTAANITVNAKGLITAASSTTAATTATSPLSITSNNISLGYDNSTIGVTSNQLVVNTGGITNTQISGTAAIAYSKLALTGSVVNSDISSSAAIAYSKLSLSNSILGSDISTSAAIPYSKLSLGLSIVNSDISTSAAIAYSKLALTGSVVNADISSSAAIVYSKLSLSNSIVNSDINGSAAIAYSKLSLGSSIVNSDIASGAAIVYSKLALTGGIVNTDINTSAAIAYSKLNLTGNIVNSDISSSAAIAYSKLNLASSVQSSDITSGSATSGQFLTANGTGGVSYTTFNNTWAVYTPTITGFGTVSSAAGTYKQVGDTLQVKVYFTSGTVAASLASISLPSGFTLSNNTTTKIPVSNTNTQAGLRCGSYTANSNTTKNFGTWSGCIVTAPASSTGVVYCGKSTTDFGNLLIPANGNAICDSSTAFSCFFEVILA